MIDSQSSKSSGYPSVTSILMLLGTITTLGILVYLRLCGTIFAALAVSASAIITYIEAKKEHKRLLTRFLFGLVLFTVFGAGYSEYQDQSHINELNAKLAAIPPDLQTAAEEIRKLEARITDQNADLQQLKQQNHQLTEQLDVQNASLESLKQQNDKLQRELTEVKASLRQVLQALNVLITASRPPGPETPTPSPQEIQQAIKDLLIASEWLSSYDLELARMVIAIGLQFRPFDRRLQQQLFKFEQLQP